MGAGEVDDDDDRYAPFRRKCWYGLLGRRVWSLGWLESARLVLLAVTLAPLRLCLALVIVTTMWSACAVAAAIFRSRAADSRRRSFVRACGVFLSRILLVVFGVHVDIRRIDARFGFDDALGRVVEMPAGVSSSASSSSTSTDAAATRSPSRGTTILSNHVSWLDILVHMAYSTCPAFVAKASVRSAPLVGSIADALGCIFVERERSSADKATGGSSALIRERMLQNAAVECGTPSPTLLLFPEGTTSNGSFLLSFHRSAFLAGEPLRLVVLKVCKYVLAIARVHILLNRARSLVACPSGDSFLTHTHTLSLCRVIIIIIFIPLRIHDTSIPVLD